MRPLTDEDVLGPGVLLGREGEIIVELRERLFREHVKLKIAIEGEEFHSAPPEAVPLPLLQRLLAELRRWKSCQSIGACRQCVDDGVILQLSLVVEQALRSPPLAPSTQEKP